jgi:hypothetical protein
MSGGPVDAGGVNILGCYTENNFPQVADIENLIPRDYQAESRIGTDAPGRFTIN